MPPQKRHQTSTLEPRTATTLLVVSSPLGPWKSANVLLCLEAFPDLHGFPRVEQLWLKIAALVTGVRDKVPKKFKRGFSDVFPYGQHM